MTQRLFEKHGDTFELVHLGRKLFHLLLQSTKLNIAKAAFIYSLIQA